MSLEKWERFRSLVAVRILALVAICGMPLLCQATAVAPPDSLSQIIFGVVLDDRNARPIEGAVVAIEALGGAPVDAAGIQTGSDGGFRLSASSGSQYRIMVQKQGFMNLSRVITGARPGTSPVAIDLGELRLIAQCAISGKVIDSGEKPLMGATVQLSRVSLEGLTTTLTAVAMTTANDLGEYRIFGLEPGTYYVSALFQDLADVLGLRQRIAGTNPSDITTEDHAVTYYPGSPDIETARPLRLKPGVALSNLDIPVTTAQSYSVSGLVTSLPTNPPTFMVHLQPLYPGSLGVSRGYTLSPGRAAFNFKSIPPGAYVVRVEFKSGGRLLSARQEIVVGGASVEGLVLDLRAPFSIVGKVSMNGSADLPRNLQISLNAVDRQFRAPIKPQIGGRFQIEDAGPDRYSINVNDESGTIYIKSVALDTETAGITGINILDSNHVLRIEISDKAGRIEGIALDNDQHPIAGGLAILLGPSTQDFRSQAVVINRDGKFSFKSLTPGKYRISCFSDLKVPADATWDVQKSVKEEGQEISVGEGDNRQVSLKAVLADPQ
ncbi:MAG TPA: carboxypeptidase-like regulatory domain-containing protein [Candidatus Angelobacter sp.]|jgi:uncharacterized protein (DUF2141 family)|nr:carboxypeptidase-like regulatory domain-containing protein [Candidatus Angelobacter sp.]